MSSLFAKVARFARSPQGQKLARKAASYANSPEGKRRIAQARQRIAARRRPR